MPGAEVTEVAGDWRQTLEHLMDHRKNLGFYCGTSGEPLEGSLGKEVMRFDFSF